MMPYQVRQMDRLTGSAWKGKACSMWLVRTSYVSCSEGQSPLYRMVSLRLPGES